MGSTIVKSTYCRFLRYILHTCTKHSITFTYLKKWPTASRPTIPLARKQSRLPSCARYTEEVDAASLSLVSQCSKTGFEESFASFPAPHSTLDLQARIDPRWSSDCCYCPPRWSGWSGQEIKGHRRGKGNQATWVPGSWFLGCGLTIRNSSLGLGHLCLIERKMFFCAQQRVKKRDVSI